MKNDPYNHTKRKHRWGWNNRGANERAGKVDWTRRRKYQALEDKKNRYLRAYCELLDDTQTAKHRRGSWADQTIRTREEGPTVQQCGDCEVAGKWINCQYTLGPKYGGKCGPIQKNKKAHGKNWKIANPISKIDDYVTHFQVTQSGSRSLDHLGGRGIEEKLLLTEALILKDGTR